MAIDNPKDAFKEQYMRGDEKSPLGLVIFTGKLAFPKAALPLESGIITHIGLSSALCHASLSDCHTGLRELQWPPDKEATS
jgi:hypothetical protein